MSRSGYTDDYDQWEWIKWRGQVASAIRGKRGQAFLRELVDALDAMPAKRLVAEDLQTIDGQVCALGAIGLRRGIDMAGLDPENYDRIADVIGIAHQLVQEVEFINDEAGYAAESPETRWRRVRDWAVRQIKGGT